MVTERIYRRNRGSRAPRLARAAVFEYSAGWYDRLAILGYMPTEFEQQLSERIAAV